MLLKTHSAQWELPSLSIPRKVPLLYHHRQSAWGFLAYIAGKTMHTVPLVIFVTAFVKRTYWCNMVPWTKAPSTSAARTTDCINSSCCCGRYDARSSPYVRYLSSVTENMCFCLAASVEWTWVTDSISGSNLSMMINSKDVICWSRNDSTAVLWEMDVSESDISVPTDSETKSFQPCFDCSGAH